MRRHAIRKNMMEYVWGDFADGRNLSIAHNISINQVLYPVTKVVSERRFYWFVPSDFLTYTRNTDGYNTSDYSISYSAGGTAAGYSAKTLHYSWNYGRRSYFNNGTDYVSPGKSLNTEEFCYQAITQYVTSSSDEEIYAKVYTTGNASLYFNRAFNGGTKLKKCKFNNRTNYPQVYNDYNDTGYMFNSCPNIRFIEMGNLITLNSSSASLRYTFKGADHAVIDLRDCVLPNVANTFMNNVSTITVVYSNLANLGNLPTYFSNVKCSKFAIMAETVNSDDEIVVGTYNADDYTYVTAYNGFAVVNDKTDDYSNSFNTDTNYRDAISDNDNIKRLDLSLLNTSHVTNMYRMFSGCTALEELNLSGIFNTLKVTNLTQFLYRVPTTCKIYYNPNTMKSTFLTTFSSYNWIPVDENFRLF